MTTVQARVYKGGFSMPTSFHCLCHELWGQRRFEMQRSLKIDLFTLRHVSGGCFIQLVKVGILLERSLQLNALNVT